MLDGRKKNGWLENFGHKDQSIDNIFQDKICQPSNNLASGSKVWEKTVFDSMVCTSRVECQTVWFKQFGSGKFKGKGKMGRKEKISLNLINYFYIFKLIVFIFSIIVRLNNLKIFKNLINFNYIWFSFIFLIVKLNMRKLFFNFFFLVFLENQI